MGELTLTVAPGRLTLLSERAAWLPDESVLLLADVHLAKAQSFRRLGVPVPEATTTDNLVRMSRLIDRLRPRRLVFLGDLLHARHARSVETLEAIRGWRERHAELPMTLVRGNHDVRAGDPPPSWCVDSVQEPWHLHGWALCHHPQDVPGHFALAGHLHPCTHVGRGMDRLRLPCFHLTACRAVLPAFGSFTGMHSIRREPGDRVAVVADTHVRWLTGS